MLPRTPMPARPPRRSARAAARIALGVLFTTALLDELTTGVLVVALPLARDMLRLSYAQAGLLFTAGALSSLAIEPAFTFAADRRSLRLPILAGMLALVAGFALAALAPNYVLLLAAFVVLFPAIGAAVGLSQSTLIDAAPAERAERTMTRWTLLSGVGDLLAPLAVGVGVAVGLNWGGLCLAAGGLWLAAASVLAPARFPAAHRAESEPSEGDVSWRQRLGDLRLALRDGPLLRWAAITILATTLDEIFLAFAVLYLHDRLHASQEAVSAAVAVAIGAGLAALILLDRLSHRLPGRRLLPLMGVFALLGVALLLVAPSVPVAALALALIDFAAAGWYPLAHAAAYATHPGRATLVNTVILLGQWVEVALPGVTGLIAARFGLSAALAFLALGPLAMLLLLPHRSERHQGS